MKHRRAETGKDKVWRAGDDVEEAGSYEQLSVEQNMCGEDRKVEVN